MRYKFIYSFIHSVADTKLFVLSIAEDIESFNNGKIIVLSQIFLFTKQQEYRDYSLFTIIMAKFSSDRSQATNSTYAGLNSNS